MSFKPIKPYGKQNRSAYAQGSLRPLGPVKPSQPLTPVSSETPNLTKPIKIGKKQ